MSISIGRNRIYNQVDQPLQIYTRSSNAIVLQSDSSNVYIYFDQFKLGQQHINSSNTFQLQYGNQVLSEYSSSHVFFNQPAIFNSGVQITNAFNIQSNLVETSLLRASNIEIQTYQGNPLSITSNQALTLEINHKRLYYNGNIGMGVLNPSFQLEMSQDLYVHSNIQTNTLGLKTLYYSSNGTSTFIGFTSNSINLSADIVQLNNPFFTGNVLFQDISIVNGDIDRVFASNLYVYNKYLDQPGIYIKHINSVDPPYFSDTIVGNPIMVDSYFYNIDNTIRVFQVDSYGRISSGKVTVANGPDFGINYFIQSARESYHKGFLNFQTYKPYEQTIMNTKGYMSIGSNIVNHPLQITNPYTGYESHYVPTKSMIGLYQTTSNTTAFIQCYNCNYEPIFTLTSNGGILFGGNKQYNNEYNFENSKKSFMSYLHVNEIYSDQSINFQKSILSNVQQMYTCNIDVKYGSLSNVHIYNLSVDSIQTNSFECIDDLNDYEEFRIHSTRFLFYGSNMVMNPNRYFFQTEQPNLPDDNLRIYANGGPSRNVNVIHTIANNNYSTIRMNNCNVAVNSVARLELEANQNSFTFGVINKSTVPNTLAEAFITNNPSLTSDNRQLNITSTGCRIGGTSGIHLLQTGRLTINDTVDSSTNLRVKGNLSILTDTVPSIPSLMVDKTNSCVGVGTTASAYTFHVNGSCLINSNQSTQFTVHPRGNVGIGTISPMDSLDVTVSSTFRHLANFTSNVTIHGRLDTLGNVASTSDERLKEDLRIISDPLSKIEQLTGYIYQRKDTLQKETGLLAQDVLKVLPEAVHCQNDYYTLAYGNLAGLFVEAIKALKKENEELKELINTFIK